MVFDIGLLHKERVVSDNDTLCLKHDGSALVIESYFKNHDIPDEKWIEFLKPCQVKLNDKKEGWSKMKVLVILGIKHLRKWR